MNESIESVFAMDSISKTAGYTSKVTIND